MESKCPDETVHVTARVHDGVKWHILRMLEDTFSLNAACKIKEIEISSDRKCHQSTGTLIKILVCCVARTELILHKFRKGLETICLETLLNYGGGALLIKERTCSQKEQSLPFKSSRYDKETKYFVNVTLL